MRRLRGISGFALVLAIAVAVVVALWPTRGERVDRVDRGDATEGVGSTGELPIVEASVVTEVGAAPDGAAASASEPEERWTAKFGRIVTADSGFPIADAVIGRPEIERPRAGRRPRWWLDRLETVVRCDADGRFEIPAATLGCSFAVAAEGRGTRLIDRHWLGDSAREPFVVPMTRAARLEGRVVDASAAPAVGITLRISASAFLASASRTLPFSDASLAQVCLSAVTDARGVAQLACVPAGVPFDVELLDGDAPRWRDVIPLTFDAGKTITKPWKLAPGVTVSGRVLDQAQQPVEGVVVNFFVSERDSESVEDSTAFFPKESGSWPTDADGGFVFHGVRPGTCRLRTGANWFFSPGFEPDGVTEGSAEFVLRRDATTHVVDLRVFRGITIRGRLVDSEEKPVCGWVSIDPGDGEWASGGAVSDAAGAFTLGPLVPGRYAIVARSMDAELTARFPVPADAGDADVVVPMVPLGQLRVTVVDAESDEVVDARCRLVDARGRIVDPRRKRAGIEAMLSNGELDENFMRRVRRSCFIGLEAGRYQVVATTSDGRVGIVRDLRFKDASAIHDVRVVVARGARLWLSESRLARLPRVRVLVDGIPIESGTPRSVRDDAPSGVEFVVPAGPVTVEWSDANDHVRSEVLTPAVGERRELVPPPR